MSETTPSYDVQMEADIQRLNLTAPRVTPEQIEALMAEVCYHVDVLPNTTTTIVTSYMQMGDVTFTLHVATMACVDKRNFNRELGEKYGIEKCARATREKLWELEGYVLAKRHEATGPVPDNLPVFMQRVYTERAELIEKIEKLHAFTGSELFEGIDKDERQRLIYQKDAMRSYAAVLTSRLQAVII